MNVLKHRIINDIIEREGGYVNDPLDSGGETNYGITKFVARRYGFTHPMKSMSRDTAFNIYARRYWDKLNLTVIQNLSAKVAEELADTGVNMGTYRAGEFLQRSLNVLNQNARSFPDLLVDGAVGTKTLEALKAYLDQRGRRGETVLYRMLNSLQGNFYIELAERRSKDERFVFGWFLTRVS